LFLSNEIGTEKPKSVPGSYNVQQFPSWSGSQNLPSKHINNHSDKEEVPEKTRAAAFPSTSITHSTGSSDNQTFINSEKFKIQSTQEKQFKNLVLTQTKILTPKGTKGFTKLKLVSKRMKATQKPILLIQQPFKLKNWEVHTISVTQVLF
jgi:hypothetical protein